MICKCNKPKFTYDKEYDEYYCLICKKWKHEVCGDPVCIYCMGRPEIKMDILICKRPFIDMSPHEAEKSDTTLTKCNDCKCDIYIMKKNLNKQCIKLCIPCYIERMKKEKPDEIIFLPGFMME